MGDTGGHRGRIGDVEGHRMHNGAGTLLDLDHGHVERGAVAGVDDHFRAGSGQALCQRTADPPRGAGDQHGAPGDIEQSRDHAAPTFGLLRSSETSSITVRSRPRVSGVRKVVTMVMTPNTSV